LYLLRLLDEEPRHGYEVIRLLRDRFMGVYSPSPGTIYPRLARLEEEGLVTHDEVDGRKVYRITEAGRDELRSRSDELDELEEELSASVSDIVREVREDVRQTVRSLREELTWAARESRRVGRDVATDVREQARQAAAEAREQARRAKEEARQQSWQAREQARQAREEAREQREDAGERTTGSRTEEPGGEGVCPEAARRVHEQAQRLREEARRAREESLGSAGPGDRLGEHAGARFHSGEQDWGGAGWTDWPGRRGWEDWARMRGRTHGPGWTGSLDFGTFRDLERLAVQFTSDLRRLAMQSSAVGENVISDLRTILEEALDRIKSEIFGSGHEGSAGTGGAAQGPADKPADEAGDSAKQD
jgi:DNA-binding PadR family transcriptional regulator